MDRLLFFFWVADAFTLSVVLVAWDLMGRDNGLFIDFKKALTEMGDEYEKDPQSLSQSRLIGTMGHASMIIY